MSDSFRCRVITPEREIFDEDVLHLVLPGAEGKFGVLVGHTPYLANLTIGEIRIELPGGGTRFVACSGGYAEISEDGAKVLAETAELPDQIEVDRARDALERAREKLREGGLSGQERVTYKNALRRAETRLGVAEHAE